MSTIDIRIAPMCPPSEVGGIREYTSAATDSCLAIRGIKIVEGGERGLLVSMPSRKAAEGYKEVRFPVTAEFRKQLHSVVLSSYRQALEQSVAQQTASRPEAPEQAGEEPGPQMQVQEVLFFFLLLISSLVDLERREIPDWMSDSTAALTLLHLRPEYLPGLIPALFFLVTAVRGGSGGGDMKLMAACGLMLGLPAALIRTILGLLLQLLFHLGVSCVLPLFKRQVWSIYSMAPFLAIGYAAAYCVQKE